MTVTASAFAQLVLENGLRVIGPDKDGYKYAALSTEEGYDVYRCPDVDWDKIPISQKTGANPAAGANPADVVVPASKRWRFKTMWIQLVASADVANRALTVSLKDADGHVMFQLGFGNVTASQTATLIIAAGNFTDDASGTFQCLHIPSEIVDNLAAGWEFTFSTGNLQAADDYAATVTTVQEAPE